MPELVLKCGNIEIPLGVDVNPHDLGLAIGRLDGSPLDYRRPMVMLRTSLTTRLPTAIRALGRASVLCPEKFGE